MTAMAPAVIVVAHALFARVAGLLLITEHKLHAGYPACSDGLGRLISEEGYKLLTDGRRMQLLTGHAPSKRAIPSVVSFPPS